MAETMKIANSFEMWIVCAVIVAIVIVQSLLYVHRCFKVAPSLGLTRQQCIHAIRGGAITAIGPSIAVLIAMLGLASKIGAPMAWANLAIIGGPGMDLGGAALGAKALGVEIGSPQYNIAAFAGSCFALGANSLPALLFVGLFAGKLEIIRVKVAAGDKLWLAHLSAAIMVGAIGYLLGGHLVVGGGRMIAGISGAVSMLLLLAASKKAKWLSEYTLGFAMLIGMIVAALY